MSSHVSLCVFVCFVLLCVLNVVSKLCICGRTFASGVCSALLPTWRDKTDDDNYRCECRGC